MLAYKCKQCGRFIILGLINEYGEHFCDERCYKLYCAINSYEVHLEKLQKVQTPRPN